MRRSLQLPIPLQQHRRRLFNIPLKTPSQAAPFSGSSIIQRKSIFLCNNDDNNNRSNASFSTLQQQQHRWRGFSPLNNAPLRYSATPLPPPPLRCGFHASASQLKDHHFDTLKLVQRLQEEGFSPSQSTALMRILNDVIEESIQNLTRTLVPREDQEKITYTQKVDFHKLRSDLTTLHNTELNPIRTDVERLSSEISRLNSRLREEIQRTQSSVRLDLNLEKGRIREEASGHELKIKETDTRIEKEVGDLRGVLEGVKFSTLQWLIGVCTGTAALLLGVWRLLM